MLKKLIQNIFSVKNDNVHKVWTVLGVKFKFKIKIKQQNNIIDNGRNNKVVLIHEDGTEENNPYIEGLTTIFNSDNCLLKIHAPFTCIKTICNFHNCNNSEIAFNGNNECFNLTISCSHGENAKCIINKNSTFRGGEFNIQESNKLYIGKDCVFSTNIMIWVGDGHSIVDAYGNVLNGEVKTVSIGNHCWIGEGVKITKNASIGDNSIIAMGGIITKRFDETNVIIAGNPAKILKHKVYWNTLNPFVYTIQAKLDKRS